MDYEEEAVGETWAENKKASHRWTEGFQFFESF